MSKGWHDYFIKVNEGDMLLLQVGLTLQVLKIVGFNLKHEANLAYYIYNLDIHQLHSNEHGSPLLISPYIYIFVYNSLFRRYTYACVHTILETRIVTHDDKQYNNCHSSYFYSGSLYPIQVLQKVWFVCVLMSRGALNTSGYLIIWSVIVRSNCPRINSYVIYFDSN